MRDLERRKLRRRELERYKPPTPEEAEQQKKADEENLNAFRLLLLSNPVQG